MRTIKRMAWTVGVLMLLLLAGCGSGASETEPLPEGMDAELLLTRGQEITELLMDGEYQSVYAQFRPDIQAKLTQEDIRSLVAPALEQAGELETLEETEAFGSTEGESHGIARLNYVFSERDVEFQVAFDPEMALIGLSVSSRSPGWSFSNLVDNLSGLFG